MLYVWILLCVNEIADKFTRKISYTIVLRAKKDKHDGPGVFMAEHFVAVIVSDSLSGCKYTRFADCIYMLEN